MLRHALRTVAAVAGVALVTAAGTRWALMNAATAGFAYLLLVLIVASSWGFRVAAVASVTSALAYNFFFFPPFGTLTIADPENWVALFSFLTTALIASRLSHLVERRAQDAIARRQDVERLYTFSRSILLIGDEEPFARQLAQKLADVFQLESAVLYDRRTEEFFSAGPADCLGIEQQLRNAARLGSSSWDPERTLVVTAVRLGAEPIAALALRGPEMPDAVLQGIANLVAIGLERARAQELASQVEAANRSERLRTTLLDALSHEFKTPLTSIKAATTALVADPDLPAPARTELLQIADEEADALRNLIDDAVEMARLDGPHIELHTETLSPAEMVVRIAREIGDREIAVSCDPDLPLARADRRLARLAIRQLLDNAVKYSPPGTPVAVRVSAAGDSIAIAVTDHGTGISPHEQERIFDRFYRGSAAQSSPGSGLGLSIASTIARAHGGEVTVESRPGLTTFRLTLPVAPKEVPA